MAITPGYSMAIIDLITESTNALYKLLEMKVHSLQLSSSASAFSTASYKTCSLARVLQLSCMGKMPIRIIALGFDLCVQSPNFKTFNAHGIHSRDLKILPRTSKETLLTPKLSLSSLCVTGKTHT